MPTVKYSIKKELSNYIHVCICSICSQMAQHATEQRDFDKAITLYKEALVYNENDGKVCDTLNSTAFLLVVTYSKFYHL